MNIIKYKLINIQFNSIQFNNVYLSAKKSHGFDKLYIYHKKNCMTREIYAISICSPFKAALAFFYCAYYPRIFSSMFCGEITTNRRQLYCFRVFKIAELETVRPDVSGVNLRNMAAKRTILGPILLVISYLIITLALLK